VILCVYALISPVPARVNLRGIAGERLRVMSAGGIGAVVGVLPRRPSPTLKNLRRYAAVIEAVAARTPAILPARFATTVADDDELAVILRTRPGLRQRLRRVRGRAQMTIRVMGSDPGDDATHGVRPLDTARTRGQTPRYESTQGTQYLRQKMEDAVRAREIPGFGPIRDAVRPFVKEERVDKRGAVATINHLVARAAVDRYRAAVVRAAKTCGLRLIVTGPLAPYAFADNG
jgi:Gas vesicle synthesis protein GvpL/GvpF